jgi:hypothetical protein
MCVCICMCVCVCVCLCVCMCVCVWIICVCVHVFIQDPDPDPGSDPKLCEKSDPDPEKIIPDPQHCFFEKIQIFLIEVRYTSASNVR